MNSAHPHVCGEHGSGRLFIPTLNGSSPRVWGAQWTSYKCGDYRRLIPTCVGSTCLDRRLLACSQAHPHVCGEHNFVNRTCLDKFGSSPRVWGAPTSIRSVRFTVRLIPTCVGSTLADMGFYPHTPSFRISLEPKASINPTRFLGLSPSGSAPIPASFAPPFSWP